MISLPPKGGPGLEEVEIGMEGGPSRNYGPKPGQCPSGEGGDREEPGLSGTGPGEERQPDPRALRSSMTNPFPEDSPGGPVV